MHTTSICHSSPQRDQFSSTYRASRALQYGARLGAILAVVACGGAADTSVAPTDPLTALLRCNDRVIGGAALRAAAAVSYQLAITEPSFSVTGRYRAQRSGTAAIDIFADGVRVFSEGWDGTAGWQLGRDATERTPATAQAEAPLRHGIEQPGHLWTLADMRPNGHRVERVDEAVPSTDTTLVHLTLRDGFELWFTIENASCLVVASRSFRAFHPDVDSTQRWTETRFANFERHDGVLRPMMSYNIDLVSGDTIGRTRILTVTMQ